MRRFTTIVLLVAGLTFCSAGIPQVTVDQVRAMSAINLLYGINDNETLMLDAAHNSVLDTVTIITQIHEKRVLDLKTLFYTARNESSEWAAEPAYSPRDGTSNQPFKEGARRQLEIDADNFHRCQKAIAALKTLQIQLQSQARKTPQPSIAHSRTPLHTSGIPLVLLGD